MAAPPNRYLTAYEYENTFLQGVHRHGVIYTDSLYGDVQWMSGGTHTEFHGSFKHTPHGVTLEFDALFGSRNVQPVLKKAILWTTAGGEWQYVGHDYAHRFVRMKPLSQWMYDQAVLAWRLHLQWIDGHWEPVDADGNPRAAPLPIPAPEPPPSDDAEEHGYTVVPAAA